MDTAIAQQVLAALGPLGVLVLAVVWMLSRRKENGAQSTRSKVLDTVVKIDTQVDHLIDDVAEVKEDIREVRSGLQEHLQSHAR